MIRTRSMRPGTLALAGIVSAALIVPSAAMAQDEERQVIEAWTHSAGNPAEIEVLDTVVADFNASQDMYEVQRVDFPQADYNTSVVGASQGGLPCLLDVDGPVAPS